MLYPNTLMQWSSAVVIWPCREHLAVPGGIFVKTGGSYQQLVDGDQGRY